MSSSKTPKPSLRNLAAGDVLFREGEVGDYAYQVVKGKIEVCKFNGDEYITLSILEKGAFGEMALTNNLEVQWQEVDEAVVKEIDKDALLGFLKKLLRPLLTWCNNLQVMLGMLMKNFLRCLFPWLRPESLDNENEKKELTDEEKKDKKK